MKKFFFSITLLCILSYNAFSQAVSDKAVIPVSVNLMSIMRLTIVSGGNIEFTFNTIDDYETGISGEQTVFTVSSSVDFDVTFTSEEATLRGADDPTATLAGTFIEIGIVCSAGAVTDADTDFGACAAGVLVDDARTAGDAADNTYTITWDCGATTPLLGQAPDRYSGNMYISITED